MKNPTINAIALAVGLLFSAGGMAANMTNSEYKVSKDKIAAEYKAAKAGCGSLSGNANDICIAEAKGNEKVAKANLANQYKPTTKTRYQALVAKADADYDVAMERCDDKAGNPKDVCVKEAKAAKTAALADAKTQMKTSDAKMTAKEVASDARKDATEDKVDASYAVAKEKCDVLAGSAKDNCINQAKTRFGK